MNKQRGFYNIDFTGAFIAFLVIGVLIGSIGGAVLGYVCNHVEIHWVSEGAGHE